jgi:nitroreductase
VEFSEVVRRRRMVRTYDLSRHVPKEVVDRVVDAMLRAPSAGFTQGTGFLILDEPEQLARFSAAASPATGAENWLAANVEAPVLIIPFSNKDAYLDRYAEPDKGFTDRSDAWWTAPYWDIDAGMSAMIGLLASVDEGLGACFFGVEISTVPAIRRAFGVPETYHPIGVISIGYSNEPARDLASRRRPRDEQVHRGSWSSP